jgi:hypothetical protein
MKVELQDGSSYYVDFFTIPMKRGNHTTKCVISPCNLAEGEGSTIEYVGFAKCNRKDKYDKAIGKAKSLHRALHDGFFSGPTSKKIRLRFWEKFYKTLTGPDAEKLKEVAGWMKII